MNDEIEQQKFINYISSPRNIGARHEKVIPVVLCAMINYINSTGQQNVPLSYIVNSFRNFYINRINSGAKKIEDSRKGRHRYFFVEMKTNSISYIEGYVRKNPLFNLSTAIYNKNQPYNFILYNQDESEVSFNPALQKLSSTQWDFILSKLKGEIERHFFEYDKDSVETIQCHVEPTRFPRDIQLVSSLKTQYEFCCQICGRTNIETDALPVICMDNSKCYVEVHHIRALSMATDKDEFKKLDTKENAIVVCPYHHMYLHYQHGGRFVLQKRMDGSLVLWNGIEEDTVLIKLYSDEHFTKVDIEQLLSP